jgi:hypothetical protein
MPPVTANADEERLLPPPDGLQLENGKFFCPDLSG